MAVKSTAINKRARCIRDVSASPTADTLGLDINIFHMKSTLKCAVAFMNIINIPQVKAKREYIWVLKLYQLLRILL